MVQSFGEVVSVSEFTEIKIQTKFNMMSIQPELFVRRCDSVQLSLTRYEWSPLSTTIEGGEGEGEGKRWTEKKRMKI